MPKKKINRKIITNKEIKLNLLIAGGFYKNKTVAVNAAIDMLFIQHLKEENKRSAMEQANLNKHEMLTTQGIHKI